MLQINPKKYKPIKNKTIPLPLRPKFINKNETNIYFLSKRKSDGKKKEKLNKKIKIFVTFLIIGISAHLLSN